MRVHVCVKIDEGGEESEAPERVRGIARTISCRLMPLGGPRQVTPRGSNRSAKKTLRHLST